MKKGLLPVLAVLLLFFAGFAFSAPSDGVSLYKAEKVAKDFEENEFSANKKYNKAPVAVAGIIERVGMGRYYPEENTPRRDTVECPEIHVKDRFKAYLVEETDADLAEIMPNDYIVLLCDSLRLNIIVTQGKCRIAMFGPLQGGKIQPRWEDEETVRIIDGN